LPLRADDGILVRMTIKERILAGEDAVPAAFVHLGLTGKCPARCLKCHVWRRPPTHPGVSAATWARVVREIGEEVQDAQVTFSGGEPLLLPGIFDLLAEADRVENVFVVLNTSAYFLDDWTTQRLVAAPARFFGISLDGLEATHDRLKGVPGAFARTVWAIDRIKELAPATRIGIGYVLARPTLADAEAFARRFGSDPRIREVRFQPVFPPLGDPFVREWHCGHPLWPDPGDAARVIDRLRALKAEGFAIQNSEERLEEFRKYFRDPEAPRKEPCPAGDRVWVIDDRGVVFFCPYHEPVGDVTRQSVAAVLASDCARRAREKILTCPIRFCHLATNGRD
jgi:MoaA/NifB/PqqE/SkfB family radical SAM enzyme